MIYHKSFEVNIRKLSPTASDLRIINDGRFAIEPVTEEQIYCGSMALANNQYDRSWERFPEDYLKRFSDTITGKSVMKGHNYRDLPVGRFYDSEVYKSGDRLDLVVNYFMMADDELVPKIKTGIIKGVSIGFNPDKRFCDIDGKDYDGWWNDPDDEEPCFHIAGRTYQVEGEQTRATVTYGGDTNEVEAVEGSFVWLGCQHGAEVIGQNFSISHSAKSAFFSERKSGIFAPGFENGKPNKENNMNVKGATDGKMPDKESVKDAAEEARVARLVEAGEAYYKRLAKSIETRYAGVNLESTGKTIAKSLATAPIAELEAAEAEALKLFEEKFPQTGKGIPDSSGDRQVSELHPLRYRVQGMM
jgi:hypothetical protein